MLISIILILSILALSYPIWPEIKSVVHNIIVYIIVADLLDEHMHNANYAKIIRYLSTTKFALSQKCLFFLKEKKIWRLLMQLNYGTYRVIENERGAQFKIKNGQMIVMNNYFAVCNNFLTMHPDKCQQLETFVLDFAQREGLPAIISDFAIACNTHIRAKCKYFNLLSKMGCKTEMADLANRLGRDSQVDKYLRY